MLHLGMAHPNRYYGVALWGSKIIYFGGVYDPTSTSNQNVVTEVDVSGSTYTRIVKIANGTSGSPPGRIQPVCAVYGNNFYIFGGYNGSYFNDLWELNLLSYSWTQKTYTGSPPARANQQGVVYNDKFYLFGGYTSNSNGHSNQLWELNLTTFVFSSISTSTSPSPRYGVGLGLYDNAMYIFGGAISGTRENDTWVYTFPGNETTYVPVEINKLHTKYSAAIGPNYNTTNMDNSGKLIIEGNVGIGTSDPQSKLVVVGDISYTGTLYKNGQALYLDSKAPLASPALTGVPTAPTATAGTNTTQLATTSFVKTAIDNLVDAAPNALNTLNELAAALNDDSNFHTTVTNSLAGKQATLTAGSNVSIVENTISATNTTYTGGTGITLSSTTFNLDTASTSALGGVKVDGSTITIDGSGVISSSPGYTLPTATDSILGGVKVDGSTITINGSGVISSSGSNLSSSSINDLSDISFDTSSITNGQSLVWNSTNSRWEAGSPSINITNTTSNSSGWEELTVTGGPPAIRQ